MSTYTNDDLQILIATMNRSDLSFLEVMFQQPIASIKGNILIINQTTSSHITSPFEHIKVYNVEEYGLSKSRNLAIEKSDKKLCWIMDDDCIILPDAVEKIVSAHNEYREDILTFKTLTLEKKDFYDYPKSYKALDKKTIKPVLSPEITFKKEEVLNAGLKYNNRFGLGAQFQDSENFVFLDEVLKQGLRIAFIPETIVKHDAITSSDEVASNRIIYARGALAGRENVYSVLFFQLKYVLFLWRKGYVKSFSVLYNKFMVFNHGANDYVSGFEGHRINHPKQ